ncbi:hypothetical protein GCM10020367_47830 [Streptomyces sannanensis]|uniref:Uncharacterized protein n=1 Tax=Streptomyces sannanensis TaxID=285536 RepID=A0ABP6SGK5_9ACTN
MAAYRRDLALGTSVHHQMEQAHAASARHLTADSRPDEGQEGGTRNSLRARGTRRTQQWQADQQAFGERDLSASDRSSTHREVTFKPRDTRIHV